MYAIKWWLGNSLAMMGAILFLYMVRAPPCRACRARPCPRPALHAAPGAPRGARALGGAPGPPCASTQLEAACRPLPCTQGPSQDTFLAQMQQFNNWVGGARR